MRNSERKGKVRKRQNSRRRGTDEQGEEKTKKKIKKKKKKQTRGKARALMRGTNSSHPVFKLRREDQRRGYSASFYNLVKSTSSLNVKAGRVLKLYPRLEITSDLGRDWRETR